MAGERIQLGVKARESAGSAESRRLRAAGMIPGVLYGSGKKAHPFVVEERELRRVLTGTHGGHAILDVVFDDQKTMHHAVLKDYQLDPVRPRLLHVDLHEVRLDQVIQAQVAVEPIGESPGVKEGGVLTLVLREINVEALPMEVPDRLELDISDMAIGDSLRIEDLRAPRRPHDPGRPRLRCPQRHAADQDRGARGRGGGGPRRASCLRAKRRPRTAPSRRPRARRPEGSDESE